MVSGVASAALLLCCAPLVACQRLLALTYYAPPSECWRYEKGANGEKNTDPPCAPKTDAVPYLWDWWAQQNAETDPLQTKTDPSDPQKRLPPDSRPTDAGTGVRVFKGSAAEEQYTALYPPATSNPPDFSVVWPLPDTDTQPPGSAGDDVGRTMLCALSENSRRPSPPSVAGLKLPVFVTIGVSDAYCG